MQISTYFPAAFSSGGVMDLQSLFQKSKGCSQCCEGRLLVKSFNRANGADDPESRAYYECDKCGFRVKEFIGGRTEMPTDSEWERISE